MELALRSFDQVIRHMVSGATDKPRHGPPSNMTFQQQGVFDIQLRDDLFLTDEGFDASVLQKTQAAVRLSRGLPVGMAEFTGVHVHVPSGIIIDTANACCWQGSLLNWTAPALMRNVARAFGGDADDTIFHLSEELLSDCKAIDSAVLITSAGYSVYGHWLIDYLPRINRVPDEAFQKHRALQLPQKGWAHSLARIFAPQCRFFGDDIDTAFVRVERLLVPTTARGPWRSRGTFDALGMAEA